MPRQPASTAHGRAPEGVIVRMKPHNRTGRYEPENSYCVSPDGTVRVLYSQASYSVIAKNGFGVKTPTWRVLPEGPTAIRARIRAGWTITGKPAPASK